MTRLITVALILLFALFASPAFGQDVVLLNGTIIDGTLGTRVKGNVRIREGRIAEVGAVKPGAEDVTIDVNGLIVAPGFIDLQNHSAAGLRDDPAALSQISQGITTAVLGAAGSGPYLVEELMAPFDQNPPALNIMTFVGHGTVRRQIMGENYKRSATADEINRMSQLVETGMREGAFGLSVDLESDPGSSSTAQELLALARIVAKFGGVFTSRLRNTGDKAIESIREAAEIGRAARIPVHVSGIKLTGSGTGKAAQLLRELDNARAKGIDISADVDPYPAGPAANEADLRAFFAHPWVMVASAGGIGVERPQGAGAFPRVLGRYVREEKVMTLERAVRKMTGLPAMRLGLKERGVLRKGAAADVVVFDASTIRDLATAEEPLKISEGIRYVFVNGEMVLKEGKPTDARPGIALR